MKTDVIVPGAADISLVFRSLAVTRAVVMGLIVEASSVAVSVVVTASSDARTVVSDVLVAAVEIVKPALTNLAVTPDVVSDIVPLFILLPELSDVTSVSLESVVATVVIPVSSSAVMCPSLVTGAENCDWVVSVLLIDVTSEVTTDVLDEIDATSDFSSVAVMLSASAGVAVVSSSPTDFFVVVSGSLELTILAGNVVVADVLDFCPLISFLVVITGLVVEASLIVVIFADFGSCVEVEAMTRICLLYTSPSPRDS